MSVVIENAAAQPLPLSAGPNRVKITFYGKSNTPHVKVSFTVLRSPDYMADADSEDYQFTTDFKQYSHLMSIEAAQERNNGLVKLLAKELSSGATWPDNTELY